MVHFHLHTAGIAPGARIAFVDVGGSGDSADLTLPGDAPNGDPYLFYDPLYNRGVRITSNSFGYPLSAPPEYDTTLCSLYDSYVWNRPDMLLVFSAGNDGRETQYEQYGTVAMPALCKK